MHPPAHPKAEEEVRALGYDPRQLTPREQQELLEINRLLAGAEKGR